MVVVVIGLIVHALITYAGLLKNIDQYATKMFYKVLPPAQLLAFSTSSSGALQSQWNDVKMNWE